MPGRGLVTGFAKALKPSHTHSAHTNTHTQAQVLELVPVPVSQSQMLISGMACKQHCYDNFVMCGDHRMQTDNRLTQVSSE